MAKIEVMIVHDGPIRMTFDEHVQRFIDEGMSPEEAPRYTEILCGLGFYVATDRLDEFPELDLPNPSINM
ncbi:hypothetical protein [Corynebacterium gerontici]|uniref:Uncharacterized protein n=1 Tax=Corynebacterium gerontici TaxID=2079234 RepID=A0A3G6J4D2_9CORY|nr:hypothetical protein [Corynebacterium gerontici]AZA10934.1 hypothetical protein CGERO_03055 [Corynebacterium gerontici]